MALELDGHVEHGLLQQATAGTQLVGIDGLAMQGSSLQVTINQAASDASLIDYLAAPLAVGNGVNAQTLTLNWQKAFPTTFGSPPIRRPLLFSIPAKTRL